MSDGGRDQEQPPPKKLEWDWDIEHKDRARETKADRAVHQTQPFLVDRRLLKDVVKEKFQVEVARIVFLSSGGFSRLPKPILRPNVLRHHPRNLPQGESKRFPPEPIVDVRLGISRYPSRRF